MKYLRYSGEVAPDLPPDAPLALTLPQEVYSLDGDYIMAPGARLEVGPHGKLYETMGDAAAVAPLAAGGGVVLLVGIALGFAWLYGK